MDGFKWKFFLAQVETINAKGGKETHRGNEIGKREREREQKMGETEIGLFGSVGGYPV